MDYHKPNKIEEMDFGKFDDFTEDAIGVVVDHAHERLRNSLLQTISNSEAHISGGRFIVEIEGVWLSWPIEQLLSSLIVMLDESPQEADSEAVLLPVLKNAVSELEKRLGQRS